MTGLLEHFHETVKTPEDVEKVKRYILQLAMQGKLVKQDSKDEPAMELLKKIEEEKQKLIKEKKLKKPKPVAIIKENEKPYNLPDSWLWVRLGDITNYGTSEKAEYEDTDFNCWILELEDIEKNTSKLLKKVRVYDRNFSSSKNVFKKNDILYGKLRPYLDKVIIADDDGICSTEILPIRTYYGVYPKFLLFSLKRPDYLQYIVSKMYGMKMPRLGTEDGRNALIPLPPYLEQKRIVERIEKLYEQCDQLTSNIVKKQTASSMLNDSIFTKLQDHNNLEQMSDLQFVIENMEYLCNDKESIGQLRNAILSLAVQGKLVKQDAIDEPASVLIQEIKKEKERWIAEKKIKNEKPLPPIKDDDIPFNLPQGWEWVRLQELTFLITKGSSPKWQGVEYTDNPNDVLFITSENVGNFELLLDKKKYVQTKFNEIEPRSILQRGDILMNIVGASIGRTAIYELEGTSNINQAVCLIRLSTKVNKNYFLLFFNSTLCKEYMFDNQVDNARANLSMSNIAKFLIPIPPLSVQRDVVNTINIIFKMISHLEKRVEESVEYRKKMLNAFLYKA